MEEFTVELVGKVSERKIVSLYICLSTLETRSTHTPTGPQCMSTTNCSTIFHMILTCLETCHFWIIWRMWTTIGFFKSIQIILILESAPKNPSFLEHRNYFNINLKFVWGFFSLRDIFGYFSDVIRSADAGTRNGEIFPVNFLYSIFSCMVYLLTIRSLYHSIIYRKLVKIWTLSYLMTGLIKIKIKNWQGLG